MNTETLIEQAKNSIDQKLFAKASSEFVEALNYSFEEAFPILESFYNESLRSFDYPVALSVGVALLSKNKEDSAMANKLGNIARLVGNKDQAYGLFKHAAKSDPSNKFPIFNMAALSAGSSRYDKEAVDAYQYFSPKMDYVLPHYFRMETNGSFVFAPNFEDETLESVKKFANFRSRENADQAVRTEVTKTGDNSQSETATQPQVEEKVTNEDFLEFFDKTLFSESTPEAISLAAYNKALFCLKHGLPAIAENTVRRIQAGYGYPDKYTDLLKAIILAKKGKADDAEEMFNTLVGKEPYNRYFLVNIGLMLRNRRKTLHAIKYLIMAYEHLETSGFKYELREYIIELSEKIATSGTGTVKTPLMILYQQGVQDPYLFYNLGILKINEKAFLEAADFFTKVESFDDTHISKLAKSQIAKIYDYLCKEADSHFHANKFKAANELFYMAYRVQKNITIIQKILSVFEFYTPDQKEIEIRTELKRELKALIDQQKAMKNLERDRLREQNLEQSREQYLKAAKQNIAEKKFFNAIPLLESAFRISPDKQTFIELAGIYRSLKKNEELVDLANRYKKFIEYQEKVRKFDKTSNVKV